MVIDNYFLCGVGDTPTIDLAKDFRIAGEIYGSPEFPNGSTIVTNFIEEMDEKTAVTHSGHKYELREKNRDYSEMLKAYHEGVPILENWSIKSQKLTISGPDNSTETYIGCILIANDAETGKRVRGEVIGQEGNFVTIIISDEENHAELAKKEVFVIWSKWAPETKARVSFTGYYDEEKNFPVEEVDEAFLVECRPVFYF